MMELMQNSLPEGEIEGEDEKDFDGEDFIDLTKEDDGEETAPIQDMNADDAFNQF